MNTTKTGMRTVLAAAAAGALVLGSAGGVVATPDKAQGPKKSTAQTETKLRTINIKRHKVIDLAAPPETIKLRAKVWNPDRKGADRTVALGLGVFTKKVEGEPFPGAEVSQKAKLAMRDKDAKKKVKRYSAAATIVGDLWTADQVGDLAEALKPGERAYICINAVELKPDVDKYSTQVKKRLGLKMPGSSDPYKKKTVRDCVRVIDSTPVTTAAPA